MFAIQKSSMRYFSSRFFQTVLLFILAASAPASTVYNEAVSGDLSNSGLGPTVLPVSVGSNEIIGTTGSGANGIDRDYFTINVPAGLQITNLIELAGTHVGGGVSVIAVQSGPQVTVSPNTGTASGLLGWDHYGPTSVDLDILPRMGISQVGSTGFSAPLPAGAYSFWIQDFNSGTFNYAFDVRLAATPEPGTYVGALGGLVLIAGLASRNRKGAR